jgi:hypothetical protein
MVAVTSWNTLASRKPRRTAGELSCKTNLLITCG